jgi:hypothetical protein
VSHRDLVRVIAQLAAPLVPKRVARP